MKRDLPLTEDLDFQYLLTLMPALTDTEGFECLPELFSIIGYDRLIKLCKYAGGESIQIPTLEALADAIDALQYFYDIYIKHRIAESEIPNALRPLVARIVRVYAKNSQDERQ